MSSCKHHQLALVPEPAVRLRCRRCHLTIRADELNGGHCPECFERTGQRHEDFEPAPTSDAIRYRCEDCGAIIDVR